MGACNRAHVVFYKEYTLALNGIVMLTLYDDADTVLGRLSSNGTHL